MKTAASWAVLLIVALAWSLPITKRMIGDGDYPAHLLAAQSFADTGRITAPHFLFFGAVALLLVAAPGLSLASAGIIVIAATQLLTAATIFWYLERGSHRRQFTTAVLTLMLLVVGPVLLPSASLDLHMIGYFVPNAFHNATFLVARPFAVLLLVCCAAALARSDVRVPIAVAVACVLLSAISKPNYLLCAMPALGAGAVFRTLRGKAVRWPLTLALLLTAAAAILVMQFSYAGQGVSVALDPFAVLWMSTPGVTLLAGKALASLAFPLAVVVLWPRALARDGELALAWGATLVGMSQAYLLAEVGPRMDHANLQVGAPLSVFVLMVVSCKVMLRQPRAEAIGRARFPVACAVLAWHVVSGARHVWIKVPAESWNTALTLAALAALAWRVVAAVRERKRGPAGHFASGVEP